VDAAGATILDRGSIPRASTTHFPIFFSMGSVCPQMR